MKMKKQLLACALVLSLGVAAGTLPQGAINPPTAQLTLHLGAFVLVLPPLPSMMDELGRPRWLRPGRDQPEGRRVIRYAPLPTSSR